ncbi:MAG: ABC transporter permease subunit [Planctomycetes bacterium]|nr:ABC transporter permease subunit [Planctomycetota bacterium]
MNNTLAIARRELSSFFFSPIAYVVMAVFALLSGLFFLAAPNGSFAPGEPAQMRHAFFWLVWVLIAIVPAISMRLVSEELRMGTIEPLMTSPISDVEVILGKWLGGLSFFVVLLVPTFVFVALLAIWGKPDYGPIFTGYLGMLLVGGLYMAIGTLASVLTRNQIIAFLLTVFLILLLTVVTYFVPSYLPVRFAEAVLYVNVNEQYGAFSKGLIDTSNFVFFLSGIALFLVLAVKALESRKWR